LQSPTRSLVGVGAATDGRRYGVRRHVQVEPWSTDVEVHWSDVGEAYVTPVAADQVGIAVLSASGLPFDAALQHFPALRAHLDGAQWVSVLRGAGPLRQNVSRRAVGRVLLVGDAAGYVDALTGEGLRLGFECADAAVDAVLSGDAERYERRWRELTRGYRLLTGALVTATRAGAGRAAIVPASARLPRVFARAVESLAG
jgi:flavin-dependent dehydrogenase